MAEDEKWFAWIVAKETAKIRYCAEKRKIMQSTFERLHELNLKKIHFEAHYENDYRNNKSGTNDLKIELTNDDVNIAECRNCKK